MVTLLGNLWEDPPCMAQMFFSSKVDPHMVGLKKETDVNLLERKH
jgi:hypothetical protein